MLREWDDAEYSFFSMKVPKFLDTSLLEVNLNPSWVSVRIKGKLTQMKFMEEIIVDKSVIERSQITGDLLIKMLKLTPNYLLKKAEEAKKLKEKSQKSLEKSRKIHEKSQKTEKMLKKHDELTFDEVPDLE